jgi:hypothetical protein
MLWEKPKQEERKMTEIDLEQLMFFTDMLCNKIDEFGEFFDSRVGKKINRKSNEARFIEELYLEPLDMQIKYLANELVQICERNIYEHESKPDTDSGRPTAKF